MNKFNVSLLILLSVSFKIQAQNALSSDELFADARKSAFENKNYQKAKELAFEALEKSPGYADVDIFLGRIYSWDHQYDSARMHFTKVLNANPNEDASIAYADLEYWNDKYRNALEICNNALVNFPNSEELLLRKAKNLKALKNFDEAAEITRQVLKINSNNQQARALAVSIKEQLLKNKITISYENSSFDKQFDKAWNLASIAYSRQTKLGSVIARINYANRFSSNGLQAELDAYPQISKTFYGYLNFGYSGDVGVFPGYRAGMSLYANLPKSFEGELGIRYLYFTSGTKIYTASLGKYWSNFLFTARTYLTPSSTGISQSYNFSARYYLEGADDYFGLSVGSGFSPDDNTQNIQFSNKENKLSSKKISADFNHTFLKWTIISISAGIINQEYQPSERGNQFNISAGISRRF
jgi:YaiO family outer membrane protein